MKYDGFILHTIDHRIGKKCLARKLDIER